MSQTEHSDEEFVTVFSSQEHDAEWEAENVHSLLKSAGLESLIVRENVPELPVGAVGVRVFASQANDARALIRAGEKAGKESRSGESDE